MDNYASGNARVGVQLGQVGGQVDIRTVRVGPGITVNGYTYQTDGAWMMDNGVSVGIPRTADCGCPGADTWSYLDDTRVCVRCDGWLPEPSA